MPVPVPVYETFSVHRGVKPKNVLQAATNSADPDSVYNGASNYVIRSAGQPPAIEAGIPSRSYLRETHSNWTSFAPSCLEDNPRLALRPEVAREWLKPSHGLTPADEVAISKLVHAKTCPSPVQAGRITMGLQHPTEQCVLSAPGPRRDHAGVDSESKDTYRQESLSIWEPFQRLDFNAADGVYDTLLHPATTPFADFVDRVVATEAAHGNDHLSQNSPSLLPPIGASSRQHQSASTTPLSNPSYIRTYRAMAEPLSEWMADFVWKVCLDGVCLPRRFIGTGASRVYDGLPSPSLAKSINSILCSTLLQPSAIVLALWYITRLPVLFERQALDVNLTPSELQFRKELYGEGHLYSALGERSQFEAAAPFRVALLGCMLANKWLDDHTFSNKTWHSISDVPIQSINRLELAALAVLGHDLSITPKAWENWLAQLHRSLIPTSHSIVRDPHIVARKMVMDLIRLHDHLPPRVPSMAPEQPAFSALLVVDVEILDDVHESGSFDPFEIDLDEDGPLREEYVPKRRSTIPKTSATRQMNTAGTGAFCTTSPRLHCSSGWGTHVDCALWPGAKSSGMPFILPMSSAGNVCLGGPAQQAHSHLASWDAQTEVKHNAVSFLPRHPEFSNFQFNFFGPGLAFPAPWSSAGHSRTSSCSAGSTTHEAHGHTRSYSQIHVASNDTGIPTSMPCSRYVEHPSSFSQVQGNAGYFQPMWLKI